MSLTEVVVSVACAVRPQLVEDRDHLLPLRERAHCKVNLEIHKTFIGHITYRMTIHNGKNLLLT